MFALDSFVAPDHQPDFLRYLIGSRDFDAVVVAGGELGFLQLPFLTTVAPQPRYLRWPRGCDALDRLPLDGFCDGSLRDVPPAAFAVAPVSPAPISPAPKEVSR